MRPVARRHCRGSLSPRGRTIPLRSGLLWATAHQPRRARAGEGRQLDNKSACCLVKMPTTHTHILDVFCQKEQRWQLESIGSWLGQHECDRSSDPRQHPLPLAVAPRGSSLDHGIVNRSKVQQLLFLAHRQLDLACVRTVVSIFKKDPAGSTEHALHV